jgi:hypothetical protein
MSVPEFIDTYSDDVIYLLEGRTALLTHPLRAELNELLDASTCRLLAIFMIGGIELMLADWRAKDHNDILNVYFDGKHENGERVAALCTAFQTAGITVEPEVFKDYLAIKYLRNTIVHHKWKEHEKQWLEQRGFPTDTRKLTKEHLDRMVHVNQNMMFYIFLTSVPAPGSNQTAKTIKLDENTTRPPDETGILRLRDLDRIIWNNLERIQALIYPDIERAAITKEYNWAQGLTTAEIDAMPHEERKKLFYLAARRAGENNHALLARHRALATEALGFWQEYWQRAITTRGLRDEELQQSLDVLTSPHFATLAAQEPWIVSIASVPSKEVAELLDRAFGNSAPFTAMQIASALCNGRLVYDLIRNIMPVALLTLDLPIVDPANTTAYLKEAARAMVAYRLNRAWYAWVEQEQPPTEDCLAFYESMSTELDKRSPTQDGR